MPWRTQCIQTANRKLRDNTIRFCREKRQPLRDCLISEEDIIRMSSLEAHSTSAASCFFSSGCYWPYCQGLWWCLHLLKLQMLFWKMSLIKIWGWTDRCDTKRIRVTWKFPSDPTFWGVRAPEPRDDQLLVTALLPVGTNRTDDLSLSQDWSFPVTNVTICYTK